MVDKPVPLHADNVVRMYPKNAADNPDLVLEQVVGQLKDVLVLGWDDDGDLTAFSSSGLSRKAEVLWLLECFKAALMSGEYDGG